jgi:hypothetical protein
LSCNYNPLYLVGITPRCAWTSDRGQQEVEIWRHHHADPVDSVHIAGSGVPLAVSSCGIEQRFIHNQETWRTSEE